MKLKDACSLEEVMTYLGSILKCIKEYKGNTLQHITEHRMGWMKHKLESRVLGEIQ